MADWYKLLIKTLSSALKTILHTRNELNHVQLYRLVCAVRGDKLELPSPHNWGHRRNSPADVVWCRNKTTVHFYYNIFNDFMCELLTELQLNISISVIYQVERRHIKQRTLSEKCVHRLSVFGHPESHLYYHSFNTVIMHCSFMLRF